MKLRLMPLANGELTALSLSGAVSTTMSPSRRRRLFKTLAQAGELEVALSVGADGLHDWCDAWTRAVEGVPSVSVRFELSGRPSVGGRHDS
jgi:hypothetical protein